MSWIKAGTKQKPIWKNDKIGRWIGVQKVRNMYRAYTIKNGYITHGDFKNRKLALKQVMKFKGYK